MIDDPPAVHSDTLDIPATEELSITAFSGNETYFSAGLYDDPLFGMQEIIGMVNPSLSVQGVDSIGQEASGYLKLYIDQVYGDSNAVAEFDLIEIGRRWRAPAWRQDSIPVLTNNIVASFQVTSNDSILIPLDQEWFNRYGDYFRSTSANRDSLYRQNMYGLALVPKNEAKILSFESGLTQLVIDNHEPPGTDEDDPEPGIFRQLMRATGFSINREEIPEYDGRTAVLNTFENTFRLRFNVTEEFIGSRNISRTELVLYEDTTAMQNLPAGHNRIKAHELNVYYLDENETERAVLKDSDLVMVRNEDDHSFRVNLTNYVNANLVGTMDERDFYVIVRGNNGRIIPTLLYNETSEERRPRILITRVNPEINE